MEVSFYSIKGMMENTQKVEIKTLKGLFQLTRSVLETEIKSYPISELKCLYQYALAGSHKIEEVNTYDVLLNDNIDNARISEPVERKLEEI